MERESMSKSRQKRVGKARVITALTEAGATERTRIQERGRTARALIYTLAATCGPLMLAVIDQIKIIH